MIWIIRETIWTVIKSRRISAGGLIEIQSQFLSSDSLISKPFRYLVPSGPTWRRNRIDPCFRPLLCSPQKFILKYIYFLSTSLRKIFPGNQTTKQHARFETIPTLRLRTESNHGVFFFSFSWKEKKRRKEKDRISSSRRNTRKERKSKS